MKKQGSIVKSPVELELEKINLNNLAHFKNIQIEYHLLRLLSEILTQNEQLVGASVYQKIFTELLNFEEIEAVRMLPLFERFSYELWNNENLAIDIREKTSFYRIISNWIVNFELRSGKLDNIASQFQLILAFMRKETKTILERLVMMEEIYEDLKELISEEFWVEEEQIKVDMSYSGKFKHQLGKQAQQNKEPCSEKDVNTVQAIFQLIETILNPLFYRINKNLYRNCTYGNISFSNVKNFLQKCIFFILKQKAMPSHMQTQLTKIALIYLQFLNHEESEQILNLIKHLMLRTSKAVRFALVIQYVELYEYLEVMGFEDVIEELQNIIYFRELIIGKKIVEESIQQMGNSIHDSHLSYRDLYIKAGVSKRAYFSNESQDTILKLDVIVEQNDVNIRICYFNNIKVEAQPSQFNKFIFQTVANINDCDVSKLKAEQVYWKEQKSTSKKLELKLRHKGLYWLQFDNSYSWVIPKNIKYRLELYQPVIIK